MPDHAHHRMVTVPKRLFRYITVHDGFPPPVENDFKDQAQAVNAAKRTFGSCCYWVLERKRKLQSDRTGRWRRPATQRVRRGVSFQCADGYCRRYLPAARDKNPEDSGASHTGSRCVKD